MPIAPSGRLPVESSPKAGKGEPPSNWISIFGFVIVTKADLLAATAFLLSLGTLLYQASVWMQGSRPRLFRPDVVYIFFDQYANNRTVTRFAGQLSFLNDAPPDNDAIVERVELVVTAGNVTFREPWLNVATVKRAEKQFLINSKDAAHPFIVRSGTANSDMYSFAPQDRTCGTDDRSCQADSDFLDDVAFLTLLGKAKNIELTFEVHYLGSDDVQKVECAIPVSPGLMTYLAENSWFAARCIDQRPS